MRPEIYDEVISIGDPDIESIHQILIDLSIVESPDNIAQKAGCIGQEFQGRLGYFES